MSEPNVFLGELTRKELGEGIAGGTLRGAIVPIAATEQHHDHLAMIHDTATATEIARRVALGFHPQVLVTPTVAMGVSEHHMTKGGALTIRPQVFLEYVHDVCHSLARLGFRHILVLNGHGGNRREVLESVAPQEMERLLGLGVVYVTYWLTCPPEFYEQNLQVERSAGHAGEFETSQALYLYPERVRPDAITYENAALGTREKGEKILQAVVQGVSEEVRRMLAR